MPATKENIRRWLNEGVNQHATHVIVVVDTFDYTDFPVYVSPDENVQEKVRSNQDDMHRVEEVYNLALNLNDQMAERRVWNL